MLHFVWYISLAAFILVLNHACFSSVTLNKMLTRVRKREKEIEEEREGDELAEKEREIERDISKL